MTSLNFKNSSVYILDDDHILPIVPNSIGNYVLGYSDMGVFNLMYVGRSDTDLQKEIQAQGANKQKKFDKKLYTHFMFDTSAKTPEEAYYKECTNYHDFISYFNPKQGGNEIHPALPEGNKYKDIKCPVRICDYHY